MQAVIGICLCAAALSLLLSPRILPLSFHCVWDRNFVVAAGQHDADSRTGKAV